MANEIFQQFGAAVSLSGSDIIPIQQGSSPSAVYRYTTPTQLVEYIGLNAVVWGNITGVLSDQTDLQDALDAKIAIGGNISQLTNNAGYITTASLASYLTIAAAASTYVPLTRTINGSPLSSDITITNITGNAGTVTTINGQIAAGANISITGAGTTGSPYTIVGSLTSGTSLNSQIASSFASNNYLQRLTNKAGFAKSGNRGPRFLLIGDSTDVTGVVGGSVNGWMAYLANNLCSSGIANANYEFTCVGAATAFGYSDSRITIGNSWTLDSVKTSMCGETYKASTTTNAFTFTPTSPTDTCRVWYIQQSGGGTISLDYSGLGTITQSTSGTSGVGSFTLSTGANGSWAYNVKWVSGGEANIIAFETWDSTRQAWSFMSTALGATGTDDWSDDTNAYSWLPAMVALAPDVVILGSLVNDMGPSGLDPAQYSTYISGSQTRMRKIMDAFRAASPSVEFIIRTQNPQNPTTSTGNQRPVIYQDQYVEMVRGLATEYNGLLVDIYKAVRSYANGSTLTNNYYIDDWVHMAGTGWGMVSGEFVTALQYCNIGSGNGLQRYTLLNGIDIATSIRINGNVFLRYAASGSPCLGINALPNGAGVWNVSIGDNTNNNGGGNSNTVGGYNALSAAGFKLSCTAFGKDAGSGVTTGGGTFIGEGVGTAASRTGSGLLLIGSGARAVDTPAAGTANYINIEDTIMGFHRSATNGGLSILGVESCIGVLIGANFNVTTDNAIPIIIAGTKYQITRIVVTNASTSLTTAVGGVYTGTSKSGTAVVAAGQVYTACTAATKVGNLTIAAAGTADTFTSTNLYLSLTTPQGSAATADIFVYGIPMP